MEKNIRLTVFVNVVFAITAVAQISTGLIAYYPFNGNANDQSGNNYNGTVSGAILTSDRFGNTNSAYSFNGTSDYITVADNSTLRLSNTDYSISVWVYETSRTSTQEAIISKRDTGSNNGYLLNIEGNTQPSPGLTNLIVSGGFDPRAYSATVVPLNVWKHIVVTYQLSSQTVKTYIDGILDNTTNGIPSPNSATTIAMKIGADAISSTSYFFHGKIDDIGMYDRMLSDTEIMQIFLSTCTPVTTGLIARYDFNGNANDLSGNNNNGTVSGATLTSDRFGNANSAYSFNGTSDHITVADNTALRLNNTDYTISIWINETSRTSIQEAIISKRGAGSSNGYLLNIEGDAQPSPGLVNLSVSGGFDPRAYSTSSVPLNTWKHIVITYQLSSQTVKTYIDGVLDNTTTGIPSPNAATTAAMEIGADGTNTVSYFFHGKIDDIKIYDQLLTDCGIDSLFNTSNPVSIENAGQINLNAIHIYPNPASESIAVNCDNYRSMAGYTLNIANILGQTVFTDEINRKESFINCSDWAGKGIYFVQIIDAQKNIVGVKKIILQ